MSRAAVNRFIAALADELSRLRLEGAILLAPSNRVGASWLDQAAAVAGVAANVRVMTPSRLLALHALPGLAEDRLARPDETDRLAVVAQALREARSGGGDGYFAPLGQPLSLLRGLDRTFTDFARAGLTDGSVLARVLRPRERGRELARLYRRYRELLAGKRFAMPDEEARFAADRLRDGAATPVLLVPADFFDHAPPGGLALVEAWPAGRRRVLEVDDGLPDAAFDFIAADGGMNEAREAFRRILAGRIALDRIEIVVFGGVEATARACLAAREAFGDGRVPVEDLPLTFESGLPARFSGPSRLVSAWLGWLRAGAGPAGLAGLLASGLIDGGEKFPDASTEHMARIFAALPESCGGGKPAPAVRRPESAVDADALRGLDALLADILPPTPGDAGAEGMLLAARRLLTNWAAVGGELDGYARARLLEDRFIAGQATPWPGFDAAEWLAGLADGLQLLGRGPQPGKAHVSGPDGGHAGREFLFILGLDDGVFPGGGRQDPALLDAERARLSPALPLAAEAGARNEARLRRLLARRRGTVVVSHSTYDLARGAEAFPADLFGELARSVDGKTVRAAYLPGRPEKRLCSDEFWTDALGGRGVVPSPESEQAYFPRLIAGRAAESARRSDVFTAYDGFVPDAAGIPESLSPTQLEALRANPQEYFFRWTLGVTPPGRPDGERGRWLNRADRGSLLHETFYEFQRQLTARGERADLARHLALLEETLADRIGHWRREIPPANATDFELECRDLAECARVFLVAETVYQKTARPVHLEAVFGMEGRNAPWNDGRPAELRLPSGRSVRLRGRLDRVDETESGGLVVWDYKTGSPAAFSAADPFKNGKLQTALYAAALDSFVRPGGGRVVASGYFFPSPETGGMRILHAAADLEPVREALDRLAGLLEAGAFPYSPKPAKSHDYAAIFDAAGGADRLARQAMRKAERKGAPAALAAWLDLWRPDRPGGRVSTPLRKTL
ncbi:MAG: PD-(D/E)XK nuclease family protein [Planctomycetota bacterium]|jgi:RecB family exonuclease|nr:PD-(D/E)XK nuclease family protein [Planctomycetota bacterium]